LNYSLPEKMFSWFAHKSDAEVSRLLEPSHWAAGAVDQGFRVGDRITVRAKTDAGAHDWIELVIVKMSGQHPVPEVALLSVLTPRATP